MLYWLYFYVFVDEMFILYMSTSFDLKIYLKVLQLSEEKMC